ncbi:TPA: hypothetical protein HA278_01440, partial [Candidatus Woesearchaeota archaeon]|nr:hypothetical protein [Candidatus Woesearchaeota archaeon]
MEFITSGRIPMEARTSVENASKFLLWVESEFSKEQVLNPDVYTLASWANYPLFNNSSLIADHLVVDSVENIGLEQTYDFSIPEHHNYIANTAVCHNTTNLPADIDVETVKDIYMMGWETGCKGITIYREGSRSGVLISAEDKEESTFQDRHAPKRPETLECDVYHTSVKEDKWVVLVGLLNGRPYEV